MRLTRKQKRWIRQHRGLINLIKLLVLVLIVCVAVFAIKGIIGNKDNAETDRDNDSIVTDENQTQKDNTQTESQTTGEYVSQLIVFEEEELSDVEKAASEYVVNTSVDKPYQIKVNRAANCVTIYGIDDSGFYSVPIKAMACSTGKNVGDTPLGNGAITDKYTFHPMVDGTYGQYAVRYMDGGILFHSVPYYTQNKNDLETDQFNLLGSVASLGCVRLNVRDALWIYENCPKGTEVIVYDDATNPGPLGKPDTIKIPTNSQYAGWDPTDPDPSNPWSQYKATINGASDVTVNAGDSFDPRAGVTAIDTCGNDITDKIKLHGSLDTGIPGTYSITYTVKDAIDSEDSVTITITVLENQ